MSAFGEMKRDTETLIHLCDRIRLILDGDPRITEKRMFGGLTFLLNGHILVGAKNDGRILVKVGEDADNEAALARPGTSQMMHGGKAMRGFVWVEPDVIEDDDDLRDWIATSERHAANRPPA